MMNLRKAGTAIFILLSASALHASAQTTSAQTYNPSWYVAPTINFVDPDRRFLGGDDKNGPGVGLRFGRAISQDWDVELGGSYARAKSNGMGLTYKQGMLGVDALYMFSRGTFQPYLLGGLGAEYDKVNGSGGANASKTSPYLNIGAGLRYALSDQWGLQAEVRRSVDFLRSSGDFNFKHGNTTTVGLGLVYTFGKVAAPVAAAPMQPEPAPIVAPPPPPPPRFEKITLSSTQLFAFDSAVLRLPQPKLDEIASTLSANPQINSVTVTGYTDRLGSDRYNQGLSQRRAEAVKKYLTGQGVAGERLSAVGKGKANPVVECNQKRRAELIKCLEPNRRVEVEQITIEKQVR
ncbi:Outer membrane protein A precursor [Collimonas arenae]|uniref:Outer membrane protein A n=1 Tax=Collimonas arenae TaxID=279058 RepID=A0A0A1F7K7_9BURK|nr:OmpA family protein [Collimonas arenae]AIY40516.1 Outer membrane protein A precursor [Collimonas arenae]